MTIEPCNDAILKMPIDRRAKDATRNCKGWQPSQDIENSENFDSFDLKAKKKGDVYKHLKLRAKNPSDMGSDFAGFAEETIRLTNDCETTKSAELIVKI